MTKKTASLADKNKGENLTQNDDKGKDLDITYVMEDPRYRSAMRVVTKALETLLDMSLSISNVDHMENVIKIIISLCIDYNIKAENIQENMLSMGKYIREFQKTKQRAEETKEDNIRLETELHELGLQLNSIRSLYDGYKEFANSMVRGGSVPGSKLVEDMLEMQEKIKELKTLGENQEIKYSQTYGRKDHYKALYWGAEKELKEHKKESEKDIKK